MRRNPLTRYWRDSLHPGAAEYLLRVENLGGGLSDSSLGVADVVLRELDAAGLRQSIKYLNLLMGEDITSASVPLVDAIGAGNITWNNLDNSHYTESSGIQKASNTDGYGDLGFAPADVEATGVVGIVSMHDYDTGADEGIFGAKDDSGTYNGFQCYTVHSTGTYRIQANIGDGSTTSQYAGSYASPGDIFWGGGYSTSERFALRGSEYTSTAATNQPSSVSLNYLVLAVGDESGTPVLFGEQRLSSVVMVKGDDFSESIYSTVKAIILRAMEKLGRA